MLDIFHCLTNDQRATVVMEELQKHTGLSDCGLFFIAVMTSLAHKEDPRYVQIKNKVASSGLLLQPYGFSKVV